MGRGADSQEPEKAKDHTSQLSAGASCEMCYFLLHCNRQHSCGGSVKLVQITVNDAKHTAGMFFISTNVDL